MRKQKLSQDEIDKIVVAGRVAVVTPSIFGVGRNDVDFIVNTSGSFIWQYTLWKSVLARSFYEKFQEYRPTYKDVTCCEDWLSFATFLGWVNKEVGYKGKPRGMALDKDILVRGNKVYAPEKCAFVPTAVNSLLVDRGADRGEWPIGVYFHKRDRKFVAAACCGKGSKIVGHYSTPEAAFAAYKIAKEAYIKVVALQHKDVLKPAVFESLMNWEIEP